jgi:hypothetical protein
LRQLLMLGSIARRRRRFAPARHFPELLGSGCAGLAQLSQIWPESIMFLRKEVCGTPQVGHTSAT